MTDHVATLTAAQPRLAVNVPFGVAAIVVTNPTASAVLVRVGAPDIPSRANANRIVPAGASASYPVTGLARDFGLALDTPSAIGAATSSQSGLFDTATIQFLDASEAVPAFGSYSFLSLSTSELMPLTTFAGVTTLVTLDIGAWGGLMVYVSPSALGGQGVIAVNVSSDKQAFQPYGTFAFWPGVPAVVTVPRVSRYVQIVLNATAIAGEPAIAGTVAIRATLAEVQQLSYNPTGGAISRTFSLPALASQQFQFVTVGLPAVSLAAIAVNPTGAGAAITFLVEASSDLVNWRQVTARDQRMSQGTTLYRALGNLDLFIRVTIFETDAANAINGVLYASIPREADTGYILNTIQQSLGDKNAPSNTNQDIYHELDTIRGFESTIASYAPNLASIYGAIGVGNLTSILTNIQADDANLPSINTHLATIDSNISSIQSKLAVGAVYYTGTGAGATLNTWINTGIAITPNYRIAVIEFGLTGVTGAIVGVPFMGIGQGDTVNVLAGIRYLTPVFTAVGTQILGAYAPPMSPAAISGSGLAILANASRLWIYNGVWVTAPSWTVAIWAYPP